MNHRYKDMTGKKFGRLTAVSYAGTQSQKAKWLCRCECGKWCEVVGDKLRSGRTKSCGCLQKEHRLEGFNSSHRMTGTKLYTIWQNLRNRCYNPKNTMYPNYGGRGVTVCDLWRKNFEPFMKWAYSNGYKEGLSLERIDVNGNYEPNNCRWIPLNKQALNQRRSHKITAFGKTQTIKEWSDETGIKYDTIERRINSYGWSAEDAVMIQPHRKNRG